MNLTKLLLTTSVLAGAAAGMNQSLHAGGPIRVDGTSLGAGVPAAQARAGNPDNILARGFSLQLVAQGTHFLENPNGAITTYGFLANGTPTEPDINTYLVLPQNPGGPTVGYDYGHHFLFQGHENGAGFAYVTRINLDVVNPDHRITLLTPGDATGSTGLARVDGSCWNPFSQTLLFTMENGSGGGVVEMSATFDPATGGAAGYRTLFGSMGQGGFEGIHPDDRGNIIIDEDAGGARVDFAANPNSFIFRFVPRNRHDLSEGKLQALQVWIKGSPVQFIPIDPASTPKGNLYGDDQLLLHTPGTSWPVKWITIHDTAVNGTAAFDANKAAKLAGATPFKRPENGQFQPGSRFQTYFFDVTGDTDARAGSNPDLAARGAWGGIFRVDFARDRETGTISIAVLGNADYNSFDNLAFASKDVLMACEDRGDGLHTQLNALDSIWAFDVGRNPSAPARLLALGRDRFSVVTEDNEPTGLIYSDGNPTVAGLLGSRVIPSREGVLFFNQQHGENNCYIIRGSEATSADRGESEGRELEGGKDK